MKTNKVTPQQHANFHKRNVYVYELKDGTKIMSFFEYKNGELYGGSDLKEIKRLIETVKPNS